MGVPTGGAAGTQRQFANQAILANRIYENYSVLPTEITTAGAVTYTAAQFLGGIILRDPNGAGRTDVLPTAALMVTALPEARIGDMFECVIINNADAAETITINVGTGGTIPQLDATQIIPQNTSRSIYLRFSNVTAGSEAYVVYM